MDRPVVKLVLAEKKDEGILWNLIQKYLYDMSRYYRNTMRENGNYLYPFLPLYFEGGRYAYFLYDGAQMAGFALINRHPILERPMDFCVAEFTIFPAYRRQGLAAAAIAEIFARHKGAWQLKYSPENLPAMGFWRNVTAPYSPEERTLKNGERVLSFTVPEGESA